MLNKVKQGQAEERRSRDDKTKHPKMENGGKKGQRVDQRGWRE